MRFGRVLILLAPIAIPLPLCAQEILSYEEYQRLEHEEPYLLRLCAPTRPGAVLYFGSRHSNDPDDPQMDRIEESFRAFEPDLVLTEGGDLEMHGLRRAEAIRSFGEFGLTRWLALGRGVPSADRLAIMSVCRRP